MISLCGRADPPFKILKRLTGEEEEVNARDEQHGASPLMYAVAYQQDTRFIRHLIDSGADVNFKDDSGRTALHALIDSCPYSHFSYIDTANNRSLKTLITTVDVLHSFMNVEQKVLVCDYFINRSALTFRKLCEENKDLLQWMFLKCIVPKAVVPRGSTGWEAVAGRCSPLLSSIMLGHGDVVKYLTGIVCMTSADLRFLTGLRDREDVLVTQDIRRFVRRSTSQPWTLVKLCLVSVSSAVGIGPDRIARARTLDIPSQLQDELVFDTPISALPCNHWQSISPSIHWAK